MAQDGKEAEGLEAAGQESLKKEGGDAEDESLSHSIQTLADCEAKDVYAETFVCTVKLSICQHPLKYCINNINSTFFYISPSLVSSKY